MRGASIVPVTALCLAACSGATPADEVVVEKASSSGVESQGTRLQGTRLQGTRLQGTRLQGTVLSGTIITPVAPHPAFDACGGGESGAARDCGWSLGGIGTCAPGSSVDVGTGCGLGSADGDSVLRACAGRTGCTAAEAIAASDDACAGGAARATLTCPASGDYTVLVGPQVAGGALDAQPAASAGSFPLTLTVSGAELVGATFIGVDDAGDELTIQVTAVAADPDDGEILLYQLAVEDPATGAWEDYCEPDAAGGIGALPLAGTWDDSGAKADSTTMFTFACTSGVLAKCARWGYKPWKTVNGVQLASHHQACTRMARADYCGSGQPFTTDGTLIDIWDGVVVQYKTPNTGMLYESSWTPDGAYCLSKGRWDLDSVAILLACPWKVSLPSLTDLLAGCVVKLTTQARTAIKTNNDSYLQLHLLQ